MSDDKFEFISDDEIKNILGEQPEEQNQEGNSLLDEILSEEKKDDKDEKITNDMLEDLLSYKKESTDGFDLNFDEDDRDEITISPMQFREFVDEDEIELDIAGLELLYDIPIPVSVLLGSITIDVGRMSNIKVGSVIPLKKLAGDSVDIFVGDVLIGRGETYVVDNENTFGVMITEILSEKERILSAYETLKRQKQL